MYVGCGMDDFGRKFNERLVDEGHTHTHTQTHTTPHQEPKAAAKLIKRLATQDAARALQALGEEEGGGMGQGPLLLVLLELARVLLLPEAWVGGTMKGAGGRLLLRVFLFLSVCLF